jgi:hypothetical protein
MIEVQQHNPDRSRIDPVMTIRRNRRALLHRRMIGAPDSNAPFTEGQA